MRGLIVKDFLNISRNFKLVFLLVIFYAFIALTTDDPGSFSGIITLMFAVAFLSTYSYDEMANWDVYAITLPLTRDNIIQAKYIFMIILSFIGFMISGITTIILNGITQTDNIFNAIDMTALGAGIIILFYSIMIPIITKVGITKARIYIIVIYMVPFLFGTLIFEQIKKISPNPPKGLVEFLEMVIRNAYIIVPLSIILVPVISYLISVKIYRKKEF